MSNKIFSIRNTFLFIILLLLLLNFKSVGHYFLIILLPILIFHKDTFHLLDTTFFWLLLFSISFPISTALFSDKFSYSNYLEFFLLPTSCYLSGKILAKVNIERINKIIILMSISIALLALISVFSEIITNGFTGTNRNLKIIGLDDEISATGINASLSIIAMFIGTIFVKCNINEKKTRIFYVCLSLLTMICMFRLGSRTGIMLIISSLISSFIFNFNNYNINNKILLILTLSVCGFAVYFILSNSEYLFTFYLDRINSEENDIQSGGGRIELWKHYGSQILSNPWGNMTLSPNGNRFAHNLWIDVARIAGLIPFIFISLFTLSSLKAITRYIKNQRIDKYSRTLVLCYSIGFFIQFSLEPIMEGAFILFTFFCIMMGIINMMNRVYKS